MSGNDFRLSADAALAGVANLPSLPVIVVELLSSLDDENVDADTLACQIARDQGLAVRILRVANSPFYGQSHRIASIADAVIVLGLRSVRTLALAASVTTVFKVDAEFDLRAFWRHGVAAGLCARALARRVGIAEDEAFIGGLLHDIGRVALAAAFPRHLAAVSAWRRECDCQPIDAEQAVLGIDHAQIGRLLAERWRFPAPLCAAIGDHHQPPSGELRRLGGVLHLANFIAGALDFGAEPEAMVPRLQQDCWDAMSLSWDETQSLFAEVETQFDGICGIFA